MDSESGNDASPAEKDISSPRSTLKAMPPLPVKTVWALGVPLEYRRAISKTRPDITFNFISVRKPLAEQRFRLRASALPCVATWGMSRTSDHDEFIAAERLPVYGISIGGLVAQSTPRDNEFLPYSFSLRPLLEASQPAQELHASLSRDTILAAQAEWLASGVTRINRGRKFSHKTPVTGPAVLIVPDEALQYEVGADSTEAELHALVTAARAAFPDARLYLCASAMPRATRPTINSIGNLIDGILLEPYEPAQLTRFAGVVVNRSVAGLDALARGVPTVFLSGDVPTVHPTTASPDGVTRRFAATFLEHQWYLDPTEDTPLGFEEAAKLVAERMRHMAPVPLWQNSRWRPVEQLAAASVDGAVPSLLAKSLEVQPVTSALPSAAEPAASEARVITPAIQVTPSGQSRAMAVEAVITADFDPPVTLFDNRLAGGMLTCILPFRHGAERADYRERLRHPLMDRAIPRDISFILVDDGSAKETIRETREICRKLGYSYIYIDSGNDDFSVGRCRNIGAMHAMSDFIFMQDIDLMPYPGFYRDILNEIEIQGMRQNSKHFLMVPYIFLSREATLKFGNSDEALRRQTFLHFAITGRRDMVEKISTGTSANVYNRLWYLSRGGNSSDFAGWGYEDLEFNTRMIRHLNFFPTPREWSVEQYNFNSVLEWRTYKASYRLFGDMLMMKGVALFHAWHETVEESSYIAKKHLNRDIFIKKLAAFPRTSQEPDPLPDAHAGTTLLFRRNAFTHARQIRPLLGRIIYVADETQIDSAETLDAFVADHGVTRVMFFNPFQTEHMRQVQQWVRAAQLPFLVAERGALPGSNFFDSDGFLSDSRSYSEEFWDRPLSIAEQLATERYVNEVLTKRPALESQPTAVGGAKLRADLGIPEGNKVLFVPLQRPGDTVTRFFTDGVSYADYVRQVTAFCANLPDGVTVCVKKHPLETDPLPGKNYINVDTTNIYDLLEACDYVWTFNSGVGVLALLYDKPVLHTGLAFYGFDGMNRRVRTIADVRRALAAAMIVDREKAIRFIHYLRFEFYSFGEHVTRAVKMADGSNMTATLDILYETLRFEGNSNSFVQRKRAECSWESILFDRYRMAEKRAAP